MNLSAEELGALQRYATQHGRRWKAALRSDWEKAMQGTSAPDDDIPVLQTLRNSNRFGPSGLVKVRLPRENATSTSQSTKKPDAERVSRAEALSELMIKWGVNNTIYALADALRERSKVERETNVNYKDHPVRKLWATAADEVENAANITPPQAKVTIRFALLKRMTFSNTKDLPTVIDVGGTRKRFVGIGWITEGPADGTEQARIIPD